MASMGPRFFKRGEMDDEMELFGVGFASMGPRFFKRGENAAVLAMRTAKMSFNGATLLQAWRADQDRHSDRIPNVLQWGHASSSVERPPPLGSVVVPMRLQWGHASSSVESTQSG